MPLMGLLVDWTQLRKEPLSWRTSQQNLPNWKAKRTNTERKRNKQTTTTKKKRMSKDCEATIKGTHGLPWWRSGWESACWCRGHGFETWSGKIPRAAEQLGPWATTTEPVRLESVLRNKRGHDSERPAHHDEEWPLLATTGESPRTETKTQHSHK